jgi:hypothetical protein
VEVDPETMGRVLAELNFSHISTRPPRPKQNSSAVED